MNPSKGNFQGPIFTISISADGEYRYDDGRSSFTFRCDGKDRPIGKNRTQACVKSSATMLDMTRKENGAKTNAYHWELSAGGRFLRLRRPRFIRVDLLLQLKSSLCECRVPMTLLASGRTRATFSGMPI